MRVLILTCNTGGGHNAVAAALKESFESRGAGCDVMDGLGFISKKASKFVSKWHTRFYRRYPELYKAGYMSAEKDQGMDRRDGPVYRYIARGARRLGRTIYSGGYGAVVCVHVIPAMMMTALKQSWRDCPVFCFVATDYTCSPTVGACTPDICVIPHEELTEEFVACGIDRESILPAGIPVRRVFREQGDRAAARKALGLPAEGRHIVLMSGSIGCGPMGDVAEELDIRLEKGDFASVLCGSNKQMRYALELRHLCRVEAVGFTTQVALYMDSADVLVSKPGGISITEAGSILATWIFLPHTRLTPTQKIRMEPIMERFDSAASVISGLISRASRVIAPWKQPTGIAEKMQPLPMEQVITRMIIRSSTALAARME